MPPGRDAAPPRAKSATAVHPAQPRGPHQPRLFIGVAADSTRAGGFAVDAATDCPHHLRWGSEMKRALFVSLALLPAAVRADDVFLTGGGRLSGVIVERSSASVTVDVAPGRVTVPTARVVRV